MTINGPTGATRIRLQHQAPYETYTLLTKLPASPRLLHAIRLFLSMLLPGVFLFALVSQASALRDYHWSVAPGYLIVAGAIALARGAVVVYPWWRIVRAWGHSLTWWRAVRLYVLSGLARYIPGQWWFVLGRAYLAEREGVRKAVTAASTAVETVLLTGSALAVALLGMATVPALRNFAPVLLISGLIVAVALVLSPRSVTWLSNRVLTATGREPVPVVITVRDTALILAGCWVNWLLYGLIAFCAILGLSGSGHTWQAWQAPGIVGLFAVSVLGGSLGLLVPQGIILREGVLVYLLNSLLGIPLPVGIAAAALTRLFAMGAEGVWALGSLRVQPSPY